MSTIATLYRVAYNKLKPRVLMINQIRGPAGWVPQCVCEASSWQYDLPKAWEVSLRGKRVRIYNLVGAVR